MPIASLLGLTSPEYLQHLYDAVFAPLKFGQNTNIITFSGAGKWVNIKFLIDTLEEFDPNYPAAAYLYVNAENLAFSAEEEIESGLQFTLAKALVQNNTIVRKFLEVEQSKNVERLRINELMKLLGENNQQLVIFVDNAQSLTIADRKSQLAVNNLLAMYNAHFTKVYFVFLTKGEISTELSTLRGLELMFSQHIVTESSIPHDRSCIDAYLTRINRTKGVVVSPVAVDNIANFTVGDPLITKFVIQAYVTNASVRKLLDTPSVAADVVYQSLNDKYLDDHFASIIGTLSSQSKDFLYKVTTEPTQYLKDAALVVGEKFELMNKFFAHYLTARSERYSSTDSLELLTPQENRVFKLLVDSLGKIISRESIAKELWGESWQSKYSEQGIDKAISNLRAKLGNTSYTITAAKGQGVLIERA